MWRALLVKWVAAFLRRVDLTLEERNLLTTTLLDRLGALPLADIIYTDAITKELIINGHVAELDEIRRLQQTARSLLNNPTRRLIREQVAFTASVMGSVKAESVADMLFSRAALWWGQQEDRIISLLAQRSQEPYL